ncbi:hypothetical protein ACLOJK_005316 [Asimina triloba]
MPGKNKFPKSHSLCSLRLLPTQSLLISLNPPNYCLLLPHALYLSSHLVSNFKLCTRRGVATTVIYADNVIIASKFAGSLSFHVSYGFDLHRLEPNYPLIVYASINIPLEKGCEAHLV